MAFKFAAVLVFIAMANAGVLPGPQGFQPAAGPVLGRAGEEYDPHPHYNFAYDVQDRLTGDSKSQSESRDGDVVRGQYSLIDADGHQRIVHYTADPVNGFNAVVQRNPLGGSVGKALPHAPAYPSSPFPGEHYAPGAYPTGHALPKAPFASPHLPYAH